MRGYEKQSSSRPGTTQVVTVSGTSARITNALGGQTYQVRVVSTTACHVLVGDGNITATTSDAYLPANIPEYFTCSPGQKVAFIQNAAGGSAYVTEMS